MKNNQFELKSEYSPSADQRVAIDSIKKNVQEGKNRQVLLGVTGSGKTYVMANVINELNKPTLVLSHNKTLAAQLYEELKEFFPNNAVKYFVSYYDYYQPEAYIAKRDLYIEKESQVNEQIERLRFSSMNAAITRRDTIVVASVSCIYNIGNPDNYENKAIVLNVGDSISLSKLSADLTLMRYNRNGEDFQSGNYRVKGDVVDIFLPYEDFPIRIELFGDIVERISYIEAISGHRVRDLKQVEIYPVNSMVYEKEVLDIALKNIEKDLEKRVNFLRNIGKELEAQRLEQKTRYDMEMISEVGYCKSMENYSIYFDGRKAGEPPYTLMDYFPEDYLLFVDESHITLPQVRGMYNGDRARKESLVEYGFRLPTAMDNRPLTFEEFKKKRGKTIYLSATPDNWEIDDSFGTTVELLTRPTGLLDPIIEVKPTGYQIDNVIEEVKKTIEKKQRVLITTLTKKMAEDLSSYIKDLGIKVQYLHSDVDTVERVDILRDLRLGEYDVLVGINLLREGIDLPEVSLVLILDADKEGFLRSKTSLIQTIGRAARHVEGRVVMYADRITESMEFAISETNRRRKYQEEYNTKFGITPTSIVKGVRDRLVEQDDKEVFNYNEWAKDAKPPKTEIKRVIKELEDKMHIYASTLQFEKAAQLRDQIADLRSI